MRTRSLVALAVVGTSLVGACTGERASLDSVERVAPPSSGPAVEHSACAEREVVEADGSVVDSLLALFADTPIVAFGEHHGSSDEHRILQALVCDPRFAHVVDDVVVEFGNARLQDVVDRYVGGGDVDADELAAVWRESSQRSGVWEAPVYRQFFAVVRSVNQGRGLNEPVRVLAGDPPIDWATITDTDGCDQSDPTCLEHWDREEHFAAVVRREVLDRGRTALLIAGAGHMTRRLEPGPPPSIPQLLERDRSGVVDVVLTHDRFLRDDPAAVSLLTSGPVPTLVTLARSPLGALDLCLIDDTEDCAMHTLADVADHYLYLGGLRGVGSTRTTSSPPTRAVRAVRGVRSLETSTEPDVIQRCRMGMRIRLGVLAVVVAAMVQASPASAKGPSEGTIEGAGLEAPIVIGWGEGTPSGDQMIDAVGFFPAVFEQIPDPMLDEVPTSDLGPELTLAWTVPGPDNEVWEIVQVLYPYADGGPLVHTEPGQPLFEGMHTRGGWFRSPEQLITILNGLGVPTEDELAGGSPGTSTGWTFVIGASLVGVVLLGAVRILADRRASRASAADPDPRGVSSAAV